MGLDFIILLAYVIIVEASETQAPTSIDNETNTQISTIALIGILFGLIALIFILLRWLDKNYELTRRYI